MPEVLGALKISLGIDTIDFSKGMTNVDKRLNALNTEFKAITAGSAKFDNSLDALGKRSDVLNRTLQTHQAKVQELKKRYEESKTATGENSAETLRLATAYNRAFGAMEKTESQLESVKKQIQETSNEVEQQGTVWQELSRRVEDAGTRLEDTGQTMRDVGSTLTTSVTLPMAGFALAAGKAALEFDNAAGLIQAELGETSISAEKLQEVAESLWKDGFGDDIGSVTTKVSGVAKALGDLSKVDLSYVTKGLDLFESRGWADQQESLRAINVLMEQFGMSAIEATDYLTKGFQDNLNFSGEFLDSISEYSTYFAEFGLTADDMFSKFKAGAESGAFQLDKVGDAMKEFSLRAKDGSKTSEDAFKALGLNSKQMTKEFNTGGDTAKKAFEKVIKAIKDTDNETVRNAASVGLFGTQYEDLGEKAFDAMLDASAGLSNVEGATKKASDALRDNFGTRATKIWRDFIKDMEPVGDTLLDLAEDVLPKVSETVSDLTDSFQDMSPEGQKTVLAIAGIAAAAGPASIVLGTLGTGVGTLTKLVSPLVTSLGAGSGLTGILSKIPGPVGLVAGGLAIATAATIGIKDAVEEARTVNLDYAESLIGQKQSLEDLGGKYEVLKDKNKLSNDELLRFRDIQDELKTAKSAEEIKKLTDESGKLQEKSGLTNDEMSEMLSLNDKIIETTPTVQQAFSDRGNSIIESKDAIEEVNSSLRDSIALELENQRVKADANLTQHIRDYVEAIDELNVKIQERNDASAEVEEKEKEIYDLKLQAQQQLNDGQEELAAMTQQSISDKELELEILNNQVSTLSDQVTKKQENVDKVNEEISKTQELYDQLINLQLAQVGINAEGSEGLAQLDAAIEKSYDRRNELLLAQEAQGGLNAAQQEELDNLNGAIGRYQSAKGEIQDIQSEQQTVNQRIQDGTSKAQEMTRELSKDTTKNVKVDDNGGAKKIQDDAEKTANKGVKLSLLNSLSSLIPSIVSVGVSLFSSGKKPGNNAQGTRNWRGGLTWVGEEGPELVHLPQGAKVIPNPQSEAILRSWNIPMMSTGGVTLTEGMAYVGERGREIVDLRGSGASVAPLSPVSEKQPLIVQLVTPNMRVLAEQMIDDITDKQNYRLDRKKIFEGG